MVDYLLNKQVSIQQPTDAFRTGLDAVLLSAVMPRVKGKVLDVGCGVGAVSLCYGIWHKDIVQITGLELHETFAKYAMRNVRDNNLQNHISIVNADIGLRPFGSDVFNGVMTNPPFEKSECADRANKTLKDIANIEGTVNLNEWIKHCMHALKMRGIFAIIHKMERLDSILHALHGVAGDVHILPIQTKQGIAPKRVIVVCRKGIKTGVTMLPVLALQNTEGSYTKITKAILNGTIHLDIFNNKEWNW